MNSNYCVYSYIVIFVSVLVVIVEDKNFIKARVCVQKCISEGVLSV